MHSLIISLFLGPIVLANSLNFSSSDLTFKRLPFNFTLETKACGTFIKNDSNYPCVACRNSCLTCSLTEFGAQIDCQSCLYDHFLNLDQSACYRCPNNCSECSSNNHWLTYNIPRCSNKTFQITLLENHSAVSCPDGCSACFFGNELINYSNIIPTPTLSPLDIFDLDIKLLCSKCSESYALSESGNCIKCPEYCLDCTFVSSENDEPLVSLKHNKSFENSNSSYGLKCQSCQDSTFLNFTTNKCQACPQNCSICQEQYINSNYIIRCLQCNSDFPLGFHYNGSCIACPPNCLSCFFGYLNKNNYTELNEFQLISDAEAAALNLSLQCGSCAKGMTLDWNFRQCSKCPNNCDACYYSSSNSSKSKYFSLYSLESSAEYEFLKKEYTLLRCSKCTPGTAITSSSSDCLQNCTVAFCKYCETTVCKTCSDGFFLSSKHMNGKLAQTCEPCSKTIPNCSKCSMNNRKALCSECSLDWYPTPDGTTCSTCFNCENGFCKMSQDSKELFCERCQSVWDNGTEEFKLALAYVQSLSNLPEFTSLPKLFNLKGWCLECHVLCEDCAYDPENLDHYYHYYYNFTKNQCLKCKKGAIFDQKTKQCRLCPPGWQSCSVTSALTVFVDCESNLTFTQTESGLEEEKPLKSISELQELWSEYLATEIDRHSELIMTEKIELNILFKVASTCLTSEADIMFSKNEFPAVKKTKTRLSINLSTYGSKVTNKNSTLIIIKRFFKLELEGFDNVSVSNLEFIQEGNDTAIIKLHTTYCRELWLNSIRVVKMEFFAFSENILETIFVLNFRLEKINAGGVFAREAVFLISNVNNVYFLNVLFFESELSSVLNLLFINGVTNGLELNNIMMMRNNMSSMLFFVPSKPSLRVIIRDITFRENVVLLIGHAIIETNKNVNELSIKGCKFVRNLFYSLKPRAAEASIFWVSVNIDRLSLGCVAIINNIFNNTIFLKIEEKSMHIIAELYKLTISGNIFSFGKQDSAFTDLVKSNSISILQITITSNLVQGDGNYILFNLTGIHSFKLQILYCDLNSLGTLFSLNQISSIYIVGLSISNILSYKNEKAPFAFIKIAQFNSFSLSKSHLHDIILLDSCLLNISSNDLSNKALSIVIMLLKIGNVTLLPLNNSDKTSKCIISLKATSPIEVIFSQSSFENFSFAIGGRSVSKKQNVPSALIRITNTFGNVHIFDCHFINSFTTLYILTSSVHLYKLRFFNGQAFFNFLSENLGSSITEMAACTLKTNLSFVSDCVFEYLREAALVFITNTRGSNPFIVLLKTNFSKITSNKTSLILIKRQSVEKNIFLIFMTLHFLKNDLLNLDSCLFELEAFHKETLSVFFSDILLLDNKGFFTIYKAFSLFKLQVFAKNMIVTSNLNKNYQKLFLSSFEEGVIYFSRCSFYNLLRLSEDYLAFSPVNKNKDSSGALLTINEVTFSNISLYDKNFRDSTFLIFRDFHQLYFQNLKLSNIFCSADQIMSSNNFISITYIKFSTAILHSSFVSIECASFSSIFLIDKVEQLFIDQTIFAHCSSLEHGALEIGVLGENVQNLIENSIFFNNSAGQSGGGLAVIFNNRLSLFYTIFQDNQCRGYKEGGGAIYFQGKELKKQEDVHLLIDHSQFLKNMISTEFQQGNLLAGQTIYSRLKPISFGKNVSINQFSAKEIRNPPFKLLISLQGLNNEPSYYESGQLYIDSYVSGTEFKGNLGICFCDEYGNVLEYEVSQTLTISAKIYSLRNELPREFFLVKAEIESQVNDRTCVAVRKLVLAGLSGSEAVVEISIYGANFEEKVRTNYKGEVLTVRNTSKVEFIVRFTYCLEGQRFELSNSSCVFCYEPYYSFSNFSECLPCPENAVCSGGSNLSVKPGFWRENNKTDDILECNYNRQACLGGFGGNLCAEGRVGPLCMECDMTGVVWKESYSKFEDQSCKKCSVIKEYAIRLTIIGPLFLFSLVFLVRNSYLRAEKALKISVLKKISLKQKLGKHNRPALIKIFLSYCQIFSLLLSLDLPFPEIMLNISNYIGSPMTPLNSSIDCFLHEMVINTNFPYIYFKLFMIALSPLAVYILFFSVNEIIDFVNGRNSNLQQRRWALAIASAIFVFLFLQPSIIDYSISLISCVKIGYRSPKFYIKANKNYTCYTAEFYKYSLLVVLPVMIFYVLLVPGSILVFLIKQRKSLKKIAVSINFGYLYNEYRPRMFYWEFLKLLQRTSILFFFNLFESYVFVKGFLALALLSLYTIVLQIFQPYKEDNLNKIELKLTFFCLANTFIALLGVSSEQIEFKIGSAYIISIFDVLLLTYIFWKFFDISTNRKIFKFFTTMRRFILGIPVNGKGRNSSLSIRTERGKEFKRSVRAISRRIRAQSLRKKYSPARGPSEGNNTKPRPLKRDEHKQSRELEMPSLGEIFEKGSQDRAKGIELLKYEIAVKAPIMKN